MTGFPAAHRQLITRVGVVVLFLLFSATAVEVAPKAIDVLQDLGWLSSDDGEATVQEAAALPGPDETAGPTVGDVVLTAMDDATFGRLLQFATSQSPVTFGDEAGVASDASGINQLSLVGVASDASGIGELPLGGTDGAGFGSPMAPGFPGVFNAAYGTPPDATLLVSFPLSSSTAGWIADAGNGLTTSPSREPTGPGGRAACVCRGKRMAERDDR